MNPNLRKLAKETKNPKLGIDNTPDNTPQDLGDCVYFPSLDLSVSKKIGFWGADYIEARIYCEENNARLLKPLEWWEIFDSGCDALFLQAAYEYAWEFVDAFALNKKNLIVSTVIKEKAIDYDDCVQIYNALGPGGEGHFKREDVNEAGLPRIFDQGPHKYKSPNGRECPLAFCGKTSGRKEARIRFAINLYNIRDDLGFRLCYEGKK
jgi:hypothetical protein